jgi:hypothetical protein
VTPIRKVARSAVASASLSSAKLFTYAEALVSYGTLLFAHAQEGIGRPRKIVAVERLDHELYSLLQVEKLRLKDVEALSNVEMQDVGVVSLEVSDWWRSVQVDESDEAIAMAFDLGPQPVQEIQEDKNETLDEFLHGINKMYFATLYGSKAPLVYFAKSSLPRLRKTMLTRAFDETIVSKHILQHVLPKDADFDSKYKAFIPTFVKGEMVGLPIQYDTACLKEDEQGHIQTWLASCVESISQARPETVISTCLAPLKAREAQIMILLLLEMLTFAKPESKLASRVDMLLDRLAIWQTVNFTQEDPLKSFCLEVILPYYASRLPELTSAIQLQCVPQDLLAFEAPATPSRKLKATRPVKKESSATLKRTTSAPANLLSEKKAVPKKRSLGREVSMSKKVPTYERPKSLKNAPKRIMSFEERRKQRVEQEERERIQVRATPAKPRTQAMQVNDEAVALLAAQFVAQRESKASFMSVGETPSKSSSAEMPGSAVIGETPIVGLKTPTRRATATQTPARRGTLLETPTRGSADSLPLFNIASPTIQDMRPRNLFSAGAKSFKAMAFGEMSGAPTLQKTVSLPVLNHSIQSPQKKFDNEAQDLASSPNTVPNEFTEEQDLHKVLDWL